jgi:DNA repair exonuclease SbcCD ATPase subunit
MIKIKELEVRGFKLYEDAELKLDNKVGIANLIGKNDDIIGFDSNSSGKSSFANLFLQVIYGKNLENMSQESIVHKYSNTPFSGKIVLEINEQELTIIRDNSKTGKDALIYYVDGVFQGKDNPKEIKTRKAEIQDEIDTIIGMGVTTFKKLLYLSPNEKTLFSTSQDTSQSKFIQELLNLDLIDMINKRVKKELVTYKNDIVLKSREIKLLQSNIEGIINQLKALPKELDEKQMNNSYNELINEKNRLLGLIKSYDKSMKGLKDSADIKKKAIVVKQTEVSSIKKSIVEKDRLIKDEKCPTCGNNVNADLLHISDLNSEVEAFESNISDLEKGLNDLKKEFDSIKSERDSYKESLTEVEKSLTKIESQKDILQSNGLKEVKDNLEKEVISKSDELVNLQSELNEAEDMKYCLDLIQQCSGVKGFIKSRIDLFLRLFNKRLFELANKLSKGDLILNIKKDTKNNYSLYIKDSKIELSYEELSSGLKARVDLLLNLTLRKSLQDLTGISMNVLIIDELISSVDESGRESINTLLNNIKEEFSDTLIFIVSHGTSLPADHDLLVHRKNNSSKLQWL